MGKGCGERGERKSQLEVCRNEEGAGRASVVIRESVNRGMVEPVQCLQVCQEQRYAETITTRSLTQPILMLTTSPHQIANQVTTGM